MQNHFLNRFLRVNWLAWLMLAIVAAALGYWQSQSQLVSSGGSLHEVVVYYNHGWPLDFLAITQQFTILITRSNFRYAYTWHFGYVLIDVVGWLCMLSSTFYVVRNRPRKLQFSLQSMLLVTAVAAVLLVMFQNLDPFYMVGRSYRLTPMWEWYDWPLVSVSLFGMGCTIYTALLLVIGITRLLRSFALSFLKRDAPPPLSDDL